MYLPSISPGWQGFTLITSPIFLRGSWGSYTEYPSPIFSDVSFPASNIPPVGGWTHLFAVLLVVPRRYRRLVEMGSFPINPVRQHSPFTLTLGARVEDITRGLAERGFTFAEANDTFIFVRQYINDVLSADLPLSEPMRQVMIAHHGYAQSPGVVAASLKYLAQRSAQVAPSAEGPLYELMQGVPPSAGDAPPTTGVPPSTGPEQGPMDIEP